MLGRLLGLLLAAVAALPAAPAADAAIPAPAATWEEAEGVRDGLFRAQTELILGGPHAAEQAIDDAADAAAGLRLDAVDRSAARALDASLNAAGRAAARHDGTGLAAARGSARGAVLRGSFTAASAAAARGDIATARRWLLVREFRTPTRYTRPTADATKALNALAAGRLSPEAATQALRKDLLDAYQARLHELLDDVGRGIVDDLPARRAEAAGQAQASWQILRQRYVQDRGAAAARAADQRFAQLQTPADVRAAQQALVGFTAAPLTDDESARRAQQLLQFAALIPVEYGRGVDGTRVSKDFEIQEAVAFSQAAESALTDLRDKLSAIDAARTGQAVAAFARLDDIVDSAAKRPDPVPLSKEVTALEDQAEDLLRGVMPDRWEQPTDESDYDLIALTLDRMEQAVGAGQYRQAEQTRIEAYAFFEFGPERRLKAFDPGLALDIEGLIWFGQGRKDGLATLIADRAARRKIHETRLALDQKLSDAAATLGDAADSVQVVTNSAILVFREGLEAVLILAAITASMVRKRRGLRRPIFLGAFLGLLASILTWVLTATIVSSLDRYGERLEAVTGLVAIGILLLVTNWFFHKVYWSEWIGRFHRQRKKIERQTFFGAQALGFVLLGLTSVYREGFETVLFLQSLQVSAGTDTVVEGAALGLAATLLVGVVTFKLQTKLPYKKMLIVTGVLIGVVLVVMVGQTARTMQGTGWIPISPLDVQLPYWPGVWLGVYPTWETIGAQIGAAIFVIGSYVAAQQIRVKRPQRKARRRGDEVTAEPAAGEEADELTSVG